MIYDVRQTTSYTYASKVAYAHHVLRLTPIDRAGQRVQASALDIVPAPVGRREGRDFFECTGIDVETLDSSRRPLCRPCLDWSERRSHLGGTLGAAVLDHVVARRWAMLEPKSRIVRFSPSGEQKMTAWFSR